MQGDLISRSDLISYINAGHLRNPNELCFSENDIVEMIKNQPTAYDVENVVVELEEKSDDIPVQYENNYEQGYTDGIYYAIDIVRKWWKGVDNATN